MISETLPLAGTAFPVAYFVYSIVGSLIIGMTAIYFGIDSAYFRKKEIRLPDEKRPEAIKKPAPAADRRISIRDAADPESDDDEPVSIVIGSEKS